MPAPDLTPHMSGAEIALLSRHIPPGGRVLEFGCGGSTILFLEKEVAALTSVESDFAWLESVVRHPVARVFLKRKRWLPIHIDIGPLGPWGYPASDESEARWPDYHEACWDSMPETAFDLVCIDGRFRVACFCQALLRCANPGMTIAVHDFWDRPSYHVVLEFADVVARADTMAILAPRAAYSQGTGSHAALQQVLREHWHIPY